MSHMYPHTHKCSDTLMNMRWCGGYTCGYMGHTEAPGSPSYVVNIHLSDQKKKALTCSTCLFPCC